MATNPDSPLGFAQNQRQQVPNGTSQSPESRGVNFSRVPGDFATGFAWGAPFGVFGGPKGMGAAGVLSGVGSVVGGQMEESGFGLPAQIGGSMATEVGLGLATRNVPGAVGAIARKSRGAIGAVGRLGDRQRRAAGLIRSVGIDKLLKQEGPESVVRRFKDAISNLKDREELAWNAVRSSNMSDAKTSSAAMDTLVAKIIGDDFRSEPRLLPEIFKRIEAGDFLSPPSGTAKTLGDAPANYVGGATKGTPIAMPAEIGPKEIHLLYKGINQAFETGRHGTDARNALSALRAVVNKAADDLVEQSSKRAGPEDMSSIDKLKEARALTRTIGKATDDGSYFIKELNKGQENYAKVLNKMFTGPHPLEDIERIREVVTAVGRMEGKEGVHSGLERGLARAAVQHVMRKASGSTGELAPAQASTMVSRLEHILEADEISAIESAMGGSDKAKFLLRMAEEVYQDSIQGNKFSSMLNLARQAMWSIPGGKSAKAIGAGAATSMGGPAGIAVGGLLGLSIMDDIARTYGPKGVNMVALDAMSNRKTMEALMLHDPNKAGSAIASDIMDDILRRSGIEVSEGLTDSGILPDVPKDQLLPSPTDNLPSGSTPNSRPPGLYGE